MLLGALSGGLSPDHWTCLPPTPTHRLSISYNGLGLQTEESLEHVIKTGVGQPQGNHKWYSEKAFSAETTVGGELLKLDNKQRIKQIAFKEIQDIYKILF